MRSMTRNTPVVGVLIAAMLVSTPGCSSLTPTQRGAVIGAATGAAAGAAVGGRTGSRAAAILVGAAVGGTAGAMIGRAMDRQAEELQIALEGATVQRVGEGIVVTFDSGLLFDFDSSALRPEARANLARLAAVLQEHPRTNVHIIGHTDSVGTEEYNLGLSNRRASSAAEFLVAQGVARNRIFTTGMGMSDPVASNDTPEGRQLNRRVEVVIYANEEWRQEAQRG